MHTVLITGASRGLGLEMVRQYAAAGSRVLACMRDPAPVATALPAGVEPIALDVTDWRRVDVLARQLADQPIDVLVNNAGTMGRHGFDDGAAAGQAFGASDFDEWDQVFRTNVMGPMKLAEAFVGNVERSVERKIVMLTSMVGSMALNTSGGLYAYRASKAALNAVVRSMAIDLAPRGIVVAGLHPGWVRTAMGGTRAPLEARDAVAGLRRVIASLRPADSGMVLAHDGERLPW